MSRLARASSPLKKSAPMRWPVVWLAARLSPLFSLYGVARTQVAHWAPDGRAAPGVFVVKRAGAAGGFVVLVRRVRSSARSSAPRRRSWSPPRSGLTFGIRVLPPTAPGRLSTAKETAASTARTPATATAGQAIRRQSRRRCRDTGRGYGPLGRRSISCALRLGGSQVASRNTQTAAASSVAAIAVPIAYRLIGDMRMPVIWARAGLRGS